MYFADLSPCLYSGVTPQGLSVGWLDKAHPFSRGTVPPGFVKRLTKISKKPAVCHRGFHLCEFCEVSASSDLKQTAKRGMLSSAVIRVIGPDGKVYYSPNMICHYVAKHGYQPPHEFVAAVMQIDNSQIRNAMSFLKNLLGGGGKSATALFRPPSPPSDTAIAQAELALKIKFPQSFISFLEKSQPMQLPPCARFYWIGTESLSGPDIIAVNEQERRESSLPLPDFLVAFYNDGMGNQICFDTRRRTDGGEYPIVFWDHELAAAENLTASAHKAQNHESAGTVAESFPDWLKLVLPG